MTNDKDTKIFSSRMAIPSENEKWAIKKNKGSGIETINTIFHKFFLAGYDKIAHNNINAKISKKINESSRSCKGILAVTPSLFSPKKKMPNG